MINTNNVNYGLMLKLIREKTGWSQSQLAKKLKMTQSSLSRYESGELEFKMTPPQFRLFIEILMGCGYSMNEALELCESKELCKSKK